MRVDDRLEAQQSKTGSDVLLNEIPLFIDLATGHGELRERGGAGARATHDTAPAIERFDFAQGAGATQRCDELHLIAASQKDSARILDRVRDLSIAFITRPAKNREPDLSSSCPSKVREPRACRGTRLGGRRR